MIINSTGLDKVSSNIASSVISSTDTETKNILNQITSKQQSLNRLSSESEMSAEEKAKERQEIQKQIAELNRKLRMIRMEKKEEAKEAEKEQEQKAAFIENQKKELSRKESDTDNSSETLKEQQEKMNVSPQNIQKILEAETILQKEHIQQNVIRDKEAIESVMGTEIKADRLYGTDTSVKEKQLSSLIRQKPFELKIEETEKPKRTSPKPKNASAKIVIRDDRM